MKNIFNYTLVFFLASAAMVGCRDEELDPWKDYRTPNGAVITNSSIVSSIINFSDLENSAYEADLVDLNKTVARYELFIVFNKDTATFETITNFPAKLTITAPELVTALNTAGRTIKDATSGLERAYALTDFRAGARIDCFATVTDKNGTVYPVNKIGNDLLTNPGQRTMHRFNFFISCPFVASEAEGTYFVTADAWGDYAAGNTIPMTVTATDNSITVKGLYSNAWAGSTNFRDFDVTITVNPANGIATVAAQQAYDTAWWPATFGIASVDGAGFVFSCSGTITINLEHRVSLGTFGGGPYNITLTKQ